MLTMIKNKNQEPKDYLYWNKRRSQSEISFSIAIAFKNSKKLEN